MKLPIVGKIIFISIMGLLIFLIPFTIVCAIDEKKEILEAAPVLVDTVELISVIEPTKGNTVRGWIIFKPVQDGKVEVVGSIVGLPPNSRHGFHIHQYGDLSSDDGTSAGDHYNPLGHPHALPDKSSRHAGDLGNIEANAKGIVELKMLVDGISLAGRENPIIGRTVVVHEKEDDGSQPSGNAGKRIAIGVIGVRNPNQKINPHR